jgi:thiopeptide-type bacteriocin biosynthesis protein
MESLESGDAGLDERWRLTLPGIDCLLEDFGFDLTAKHALLDEVRSRFAKEFRVNAGTSRQLGEEFRPERNNLEELLDLRQDPDNPLRPGIETFQRRARRWAPTIAELQAHERAGRLSVSLAELAASYIHMHTNRLLRSAHRAGNGDL